MVALQTGVVPLQFEFVRQPTQVPAAVLQTGFAPVQAVLLVVEHWPHAPLGSHAGVAPPQFASLVQPPQVCVVVLQTGAVPPQFAFVKQPTQVSFAVLQTGVAPVQFAFEVHATQVFDVVLQAGVAPVHLVAFVPEHRPHAPVERHAGSDDGQLASFTQGPQVCVVVLQTGALVEQFALATHATHTLGEAVVLHTGVAPEHWAFVVH